MTSAQVLTLLRRKFHPESHAFLEQVRNDAGHRANRTADAVAMSLWHSRGLEVHGIEIKISRADWLREYKKPEKAESIYHYCDRWWLVVSDKSIVKLDEIPLTWGCLAANGNRLETVKDAPKLEALALDRGFVAAMLKRATQGLIHPSTIEDRIQEAKENSYAERSGHIVSLEKQIATMNKKIEDFEAASGVNLHYLQDVPKMGRSLRYLMDNAGNRENLRAQIERAYDQMDSVLKSMEAIMNELKPPVLDEANTESSL